MNRKVIAVFDIGKTNKKILLFDECLKMVYCKEEEFKTSVDEDGVECDDVELIIKWIKSTLISFLSSDEYDVVGVNFSTYGASLAFIDANGNLLTPIYNYLKEISPKIQQDLFEKYGLEAEFCRKTASPALGLLLNSGVQILWVQMEKPEIMEQVKSILHFPQFLSYSLTGKIVSEPTSIGCHTFLWDFDQMKYHKWVSDYGINLPRPINNNVVFDTEIEDKIIKAGIGIHDSSASLVPYLKGSKEKFILVSTGTWCINMNPFNKEPLTAEQLKKDCLCNLSPELQQVKSSRMFMGYIHDVNTEKLGSFFNVGTEGFKTVNADEDLIGEFFAKGIINKVFFRKGIPENYVDEMVDLCQFKDFSEAYHRLMFDLAVLNSESIDLISNPKDGTKYIYVSGGFARNELFVRMLATLYPNKEIYTSKIDNSSALGAALVVWGSVANNAIPEIDLGLKKWESFN